MVYMYMYLFQNCFPGVKFRAKCEVFLQKQFLSVVAIKATWNQAKASRIHLFLLFLARLD